MTQLAKLGVISAAAMTLAAPALAQDDPVAAARANIEAYSDIPEFTAPGEPFDARACMEGKSIMTIPASSAIPFVKTIADHKGELAEQLGFEHAQWENQGNPTQWIQGMEHAGNNDFDLISLLAGADPRFFEPQVKAAQEKGLKVVTSHLTGLEIPAPAGVDANTAIDYKQAGKLMADWTIVQTEAQTNALIIVSEEALSTDSLVDGLTEAFEKCPDCTYEIVNVPIVDWATRIQPTVQGKLQANPDINYVIPIYDSMSTFVTPAIAISGKRDSVKVATFNGTPFVLDLIREGTVEMDIGENLDWIAHAMLDAEMRLLCDLEPIVDSKVPLRVFSAENIDEVGNPAEASEGYGDAYVAGYRALWMLDE
ncbi:sugar ABC transporter substrate-binding protein [Rhodosalinus halophilus]|uniref:Sugar ABC transporter substrate-binding protein n=1 Tax=Rhodosalinus halophilus TaxID=2259333 RepID=A0A365U510_9RHOB|nr:substrate-binding domain-containing protein [Rhodosalinus halophilus]RBI83322.1 sugar ABC transporter substrate-binding protein [Rhodosalinus halophilus]